MKQEIINYLLQYEPVFIGVFGSYARNRQTESSDLDLLVSFYKKLTLIDLSRIKNELSDRLNIEIDLITRQSLHPKLKPYIEEDLQVIYHAQE